MSEQSEENLEDGLSPLPIYVFTIFILGYFILRSFRKLRSSSELFGSGGTEEGKHIHDKVKHMKPDICEYIDEWDPFATKNVFKLDDKYKNLYSEAKASTKDSSVLSKALMRRAIQVVSSKMDLDQQKESVNSLVKTGMISEDMLKEFESAETIMFEEIKAVTEEADFLKPGWSQVIFQQATQLYSIELQRANSKTENEQSSKIESIEEHGDDDEMTMEQRKQLSERNARELLELEEHEKKRRNSKHKNKKKV